MHAHAQCHDEQRYQLIIDELKLTCIDIIKLLKLEPELKITADITNRRSVHPGFTMSQDIAAPTALTASSMLF